jgi:hypothetical protein
MLLHASRASPIQLSHRLLLMAMRPNKSAIFLAACGRASSAQRCDDRPAELDVSSDLAFIPFVVVRDQAGAVTDWAVALAVFVEA